MAFYIERLIPKLVPAKDTLRVRRRGTPTSDTPVVTGLGEGARQKILIRQMFDSCVTVRGRQEGLSCSHIFRTPGKSWRVFFEKDLFEKRKILRKDLGNT